MQVGAHPREECVEILCSQAVAEIEDFNPQNISNLMWGLAKLRAKTNHGVQNECVERLCAQAVVQMNGFSPQEVVNLLWACATLCSSPSPVFFESVFDAAAVKVRLSPLCCALCPHCR